MNRIVVPIIVSIGTALVTYGLVTFASVQFVLIMGIPSAVAYGLWLKSRSRNSIEPNKLLPLYLLASIVQIVHMLEEYLSGFPQEFPVLLNAEPWTNQFFLTVFVFIGVSIYLAAAIGLVYRIQASYYIVWWFAIVPGMANAVAHISLAAIAGDYFPGIITAPFSLAVNAILIIKLLYLSFGSQSKTTS